MKKKKHAKLHWHHNSQPWLEPFDLWQKTLSRGTWLITGRLMSPQLAKWSLLADSVGWESNQEGRALSWKTIWLINSPLMVSAWHLQPAWHVVRWSATGVCDQVNLNQHHLHTRHHLGGVARDSNKNTTSRHFPPAVWWEDVLDLFMERKSEVQVTIETR